MDIYNYSVKNLDGKTTTSLNAFRDKVLLIVNTATGCGFTPQYQALEDLYQRLHGRGFEILDFPCNQFGHQAPGSGDEINRFCTLNYHTTFPRFGKTDVTGENAAPLFRHLVMSKGFRGLDTQTPEGEKLHAYLLSRDPDYASQPGIKWNFTKFLIARDGTILERFEPSDPMIEVEKAVLKALEN